MSRINYSDDEQYPGQFNLWQANCNRSVTGKQGQAVLRELEAALVALPSKRLRSHVVACDGDVCAVGAFLLMRKAKEVGSVEEAQRQLETEMGDEWDQADIETDELGIQAGMPRLVAWKLVELNDIEFDRKWDPIALRSVDITPEERYDRLLAWVRSKLKSEAA